MIKNYALTLFAILLLGLSAPLTTEMVREKMYSASFDRQFQIESAGSLSNDYSWHGTHISITHENAADSYQDPWGQPFAAADIQLKINGEIAEELKGFAVKEGYRGMEQYSSHFSQLIVKENNLEKLVILLNMSRQHIIENERGDHLGYVPDEELAFRSYTIAKDGFIEKEDFLFAERDGYQTQLINHSALYPLLIGYYTDAWYSYPIFFFPFFFPFFTFLLGLLILVRQLILFIKNRRPANRQAGGMNK